MIKKIYNDIKEGFNQLKEHRLAIFVAAYIGFSILGLRNIAYLITFCYIIVLLEQINNKEK
jgi:hypothetical protein